MFRAARTGRAPRAPGARQAPAGRAWVGGRILQATFFSRLLLRARARPGRGGDFASDLFCRFFARRPRRARAGRAGARRAPAGRAGIGGRILQATFFLSFFLRAARAGRAPGTRRRAPGARRARPGRGTDFASDFILLFFLRARRAGVGERILQATLFCRFVRTPGVRRARHGLFWAVFFCAPGAPGSGDGFCAGRAWVGGGFCRRLYFAIFLARQARAGSGEIKKKTNSAPLPPPAGGIFLRAERAPAARRPQET